MDNSQRKKFVLRIKPTVSSGNDQVQAAQAAPTVPNKKRKTKKPGTKAECEVLTHSTLTHSFTFFNSI